ncbi:MAG: helix-turn-helix domain-containing protein [bacterium]|jgi:AraC-like DNA-binding protein
MLLYISLSTCFISLLLTVYNWHRNKTANYLAAFLISISLYGLAHYFIVDGKNAFLLAIFYNHFTPINLLAGPFLYFYIRGTLTDKSEIAGKDLIHFIPATVHFIGIIPYLLTPFQQKVQIANSIIENLNFMKQVDANFIFSVQTAFFMRPFMLIAYSVLCVLLIWKNGTVDNNKRNIPSKQFRITYRWLVLLILNVLIITANYSYLTIRFIRNSASDAIVNANNVYFATGVLFSLMAIGLLFFPQVLYGMPRYKSPDDVNIDIPNERKKLEGDSDQTPEKITPKPDNEPFLELAKRIDEYVSKEKPYTNPEFSIEQLAEALNVPLNHISYCLSNVMNIKFTTYRMKLRIEYAKELLKSGKNNEYTIEGIAQQAGFSTRSNFYNAFKAETGYTPTEYVKQ